MKTSATARGRHRAHDIRPALIVTLMAFAAGCVGCAGSLPRPPSARLAVTDWVAVPFAPRTPPVEYVPPRPVKGAVWVDGTWQWYGERYGWVPGTWTVPPSGARRAAWAVVRRSEDGQLFFAASSWKDAAGRPLEEGDWMYALGPRARARARLDGEPLPLPGRRRPWRAPRPAPVPELEDLGDEDEAGGR